MAYLHYYLWQVFIYFYVLRNINLDEIKLIHHVTFVNSWMPVFLSFINKKFVWGPIGEHPEIPTDFLKRLPVKFYFKEFIRTFFRHWSRLFDPFVYMTKKNSDTIICINKDLKNFFPENKTIVIPAISVNTNDFKNHLAVKKNSKKKIFDIYWAGNFVYWKGIDLVVDSFLKFSKDKSDVRLNLYGDGKEFQRIKRKCIGNCKIQFRGRLNQKELFRSIVKNDLFFYPSFEGGGLITLESMALGLPILCLDFGGAGEMVKNEFNGFSLKYTNYDHVVNQFVIKLNSYHSNRNLLEIHGNNSILRLGSKFDNKSKIDKIKRIYENI